MTVLSVYLSQRLRGRDRPSMDRLVATLDEHADGLTRDELRRALGLTYAGVVDLLGRAERSGWVSSTTHRRPGLRSVLVYRVQVPQELAKRRGVGVDPPQGGGGGRSLSDRARAPLPKIPPPVSSGTEQGGS